MILLIQKILQKTGQSILALIKILLLSRPFRGTGKTLPKKECVILGNGPSFNILLGEFRNTLQGKDLICVNYFPLTPHFSELRPSVFMTSAPEFWLDGMDEIYNTGRKNLFSAIAEKTSWPLQVWIPFAARKYKDWQEMLKVNPNVRIIFFNDTGIEGFRGFSYWFFRRNLAMPRPHNVLIPAIFHAINSGYRTIWLWGADHNQFLELSVDEDNTALIHQRHFYDFASSSPDVMRKLGTGKRKVHEILHKFVLAFEAYHVLRDYAEKNGVKVFNASPGSLIDAFERKKPV